MVCSTNHFILRKQAPKLTSLNCQSPHNHDEKQFGHSKFATNLLTTDWATAQNEMLHFLVHNSPLPPKLDSYGPSVTKQHTQQMCWKPDRLFLLLN